MKSEDYDVKHLFASLVSKINSYAVTANSMTFPYVVTTPNQIQVNLILRKQLLLIYVLVNIFTPSVPSTLGDNLYALMILVGDFIVNFAINDSICFFVTYFSSHRPIIFNTVLYTFKSSSTEITEDTTNDITKLHCKKVYIITIFLKEY